MKKSGPEAHSDKNIPYARECIIKEEEMQGFLRKNMVEDAIFSTKTPCRGFLQGEKSYFPRRHLAHRQEIRKAARLTNTTVAPTGVLMR